MKNTHLTDLAFFGGYPASDPNTRMDFVWPRIDNETEKAVLDQLRESISIYDRSSIFASFENSFSSFHGRTYGLLSNSGTSSILGMYDAVGIMPGDEIICPVYTFHATVSPLMSLGGVPIFCDCDEFGNITSNEIISKTTSRTKAVIVTHMWGCPVKEIETIASYCRKNNIYLLEDCSHAHGASINGKIVGSFGDVAAWSLQGQKIITGGEGGIALTDNRDIYNSMLLHGHYNKRPKQEMAPDDKNHEYYLTGKGLKLRAHPLAISLASNQFGKLPQFLEFKEKYSTMFDQAFLKYDFLFRPVNPNASNSWYAYGLHFDTNNSNGLSREQFVKLLHSEGLIEFDIPGSTGLLNDIPLFRNPEKIFPHLYDNPLSKQEAFPSAEKFYHSLIKLPVWAYEDDLEIVNRYIAGFDKVACVVQNEPNLSEIMQEI